MSCLFPDVSGIVSLITFFCNGIFAAFEKSAEVAIAATDIAVSNTKKYFCCCLLKKFSFYIIKNLLEILLIVDISLVFGKWL